MISGRLRRFNVETFSRVWWCWVGACLFEGFGAFMRFDEVVADLREAKGPQKAEVKESMARELKDRRAAAASAH